MKKNLLYVLVPVLSALLLITCSPKDQVKPDTEEDLVRHDVYGIYRNNDTLFSYEPFKDQWSVITYDTHYNFRIQNYKEKQVVTLSFIPLTVTDGASFDISISSFGVESVPEGTRTVKVIRREGRLLQLYDSSAKTHYVVYN
ncbi:MAG: hypothetical protein GX877_07330 [Bacteroidales bacterium]|nr:hypothetical protein [Bacteroidales bacterium]